MALHLGGGLVALGHNAIAVGLASARIVARSHHGSVMTTVKLDAMVTMVDGTGYGLRVRRRRIAVALTASGEPRDGTNRDLAALGGGKIYGMK